MSELDRAINLLRNASADWGIHRARRDADAAKTEHEKVKEAEARLRALFPEKAPKPSRLENTLRVMFPPCGYFESSEDG